MANHGLWFRFLVEKCSIICLTLKRANTARRVSNGTLGKVHGVELGGHMATAMMHPTDMREYCKAH